MPVVILDSRASQRAIAGMRRMPGWRLVYADRAAVVFLETALAESLKLPQVSEERVLHPLSVGRSRALAQEVERRSTWLQPTPATGRGGLKPRLLFCVKLGQG